MCDVMQHVSWIVVAVFDVDWSTLGAVERLAITFLEDRALESGASVEKLRRTGNVHPLEARGPSTVQVVPSGPAMRSEAIRC